jgi:uncharacterized membrane protein
MNSNYKLIRNHVITGLIFLMPVLISLAVIEKFWGRLLVLGKKVSKLFGIDSLLGSSGDAIIALLLFLILCILAGFLVKMSVFKRMSDWLDDRLSGFIPGYNDLRKETVVKIGEGPKEEVFETCLVHMQEHWKPAYLIDVNDSGDATVFIPDAPNFKSGEVVVTPQGSYKKLKIDSKTLNAFLSKMGKGLSVTPELYASPSY